MEQRESGEQGARTADPTAEGLRMWSAESLEGLPRDPGAALEAVFALRTDGALRAVRGRATLVWPGSRAIVKRYERGVWRDAWVDWRTRSQVRSFARREAENLVELAALGIPAPRALGWCGRDGWAGVRERSALWMACVPHHASLRAELARAPAEAARWRDELARHTARLHGAGWRHRDYYLQHWLVGEDGLVLIDVGRCERAPDMRERWFVKDLAALQMSCPSGVSALARLRFVARYFRLRSFAGRAERRRFVARVVAKARRMAAHEPRHVDARPAELRARPSP